MKQNPILIPEITRILCQFVDSEDLLNLALTCRSLYNASCFRLWNTLNPKSHRILRKIKHTLDNTTEYNKHVWKFCLSAREDSHQLERLFFKSFRFPNLRELEFSNAAAQDDIVHPIIAAARESLHSLNLSQCYCLSTAAINPLLTTLPNQLKSLVLYGCGNIDSKALAAIIYRHANSLTRLRLTDINDTILDTIQNCKKLNDLGLEHCSDTTLSNSALSRFFSALCHNQVQLTHLHLRDIDNLTSNHLQTISNSDSRVSLVNFDMSECRRVKSDGVLYLAEKCSNITTLSLAYQTGVTNQAIQLFITNCHQLVHVDVSGCRLLTDQAFSPLLIHDNLMKITLETLNVSGLDLLSSPLIHQLLHKIITLQELCLGVTYDLDEAHRILEVINSGDIQFYIDVDKYYTICRIPTTAELLYQYQTQPKRRIISAATTAAATTHNDNTASISLPSMSTWILPPILQL